MGILQQLQNKKKARGARVPASPQTLHSPPPHSKRAHALTCLCFSPSCIHPAPCPCALRAHSRASASAHPSSGTASTPRRPPPRAPPPPLAAAAPPRPSLPGSPAPPAAGVCGRRGGGGAARGQRLWGWAQQGGVQGCNPCMQLPGSAPRPAPMRVRMFSRCFILMASRTIPPLC